MTEDSDDTVGYKKPPKSTQFKRKQSGNPPGRPKGTTGDIPYDSVLGQMVTIRENGVDRQVTAAQAFLLKQARDGLKGNAKAIKETLSAITLGVLARQRQVGIGFITVGFIEPGNPNMVLTPLRMARILDPFRETARTVLEPWLVQAAVDRFGEKRLSAEDQAKVVKATRTPRRVKWPAWWIPKE